METERKTEGNRVGRVEIKFLRDWLYTFVLKFLVDFVLFHWSSWFLYSSYGDFRLLPPSLDALLICADGCICSEEVIRDCLCVSPLCPEPFQCSLRIGTQKAVITPKIEQLSNFAWWFFGGDNLLLLCREHYISHFMVLFVSHNGFPHKAS